MPLKLLDSRHFGPNNGSCLPRNLTRPLLCKVYKDSGELSNLTKAYVQHAKINRERLYVQHDLMIRWPVSFPRRSMQAEHLSTQVAASSLVRVPYVCLHRLRV